MQNLHKGHRKREKEQALLSDISTYPDHKLLELLLFYSIPRRDTNETAHLLIKKFKNIKGLLNADKKELKNTQGVGDNTALLMDLIGELMRRYHLDDIKGNRFDSISKLGDYFIGKFIGVGKEQLYVMLLDSSLNMIDCKIMAEGSINSAISNFRKIFEYISDYRAVNVVIAHNHPSGIAVPSESDLDFTYKIAMQLESLGIYLREHIVVSGDRFTPIMRNSNDRMLKNLSSLKQ